MHLLDEYLLRKADDAVEMQRSDGSFPAGHNGPYFDVETPVRCTAHYICLLSKAYKLSNKDSYKYSVEAALNYLFSESARPNNFTFHCRDKEGKDKCNGLVGQAWVIEALVTSYHVFGFDKAYHLAEKLFLLHPWVDGVSLWNRVDIDGKVLQVDQTFNHQLWFAMAASMLHKTPIALQRAKLFLKNVASNVELYSDGVIFHKSSMQSIYNAHFLGIRAIASKIKSSLSSRKNKETLRLKSVGYHGFNLQALAILRSNLPNENIWSSGLMDQVIAACESKLFNAQLPNSDYGFYYNLSGFEIALAYEMLCKDRQKSQKWINNQVKMTWDMDKRDLSLKTKDINTANARIYVLSLLNDKYKVEV